MENILQSYFQRSTLEEVDVKEIEQWAAQYPYFAQAQYLLSKKYLQEGHPDYKQQVAKTALFFNNPHWLHHLLSDQLFTKSAFDNSFINDVSTQQAAAEIDAAEIEAAEKQVLAPPFIEEQAPQVEPEEQAAEQNIAVAEPVAVTASFADQVATQEVQQQIEADHAVKGEQEIVADNIAGEGTIVAEQTEYMPASVIPDDIVLEAPPASEPATVSDLPDATEAPAGKDEKILGVLSKFSFEKTGTAGNAAGGGIIPIEPLHTIDYFASQGIKLRDVEVEGKDKLSIKLKSFTEWLKTMKRIHPEKLEKEEQEQAQSIQHMAEHSNDENDVLTEAMAEVFARQGLHHKAIDVYQKLSLLNPHKKAYFAAKISKLNDN